MPQEIKRLNSPCLSTLIIIISLSSPVVCRILPLPCMQLTVAPFLPSTSPNSITKFSCCFTNLILISHSDVRRAKESRRADNYHQETRVLLKHNRDAGENLIRLEAAEGQRIIGCSSSAMCSSIHRNTNANTHIISNILLKKQA